MIVSASPQNTNCDGLDSECLNQSLSEQSSKVTDNCYKPFITRGKVNNPNASASEVKEIYILTLWTRCTHIIYQYFCDVIYTKIPIYLYKINHFRSSVMNQGKKHNRTQIIDKIMTS